MKKAPREVMRGLTFTLTAIYTSVMVREGYGPSVATFLLALLIIVFASYGWEDN